MLFIRARARLEYSKVWRRDANESRSLSTLQLRICFRSCRLHLCCTRSREIRVLAESRIELAADKNRKRRHRASPLGGFDKTNEANQAGARACYLQFSSAGTFNQETQREEEKERKGGDGQSSRNRISVTALGRGASCSGRMCPRKRREHDLCEIISRSLQRASRMFSPFDFSASHPSPCNSIPFSQAREQRIITEQRKSTFEESSSRHISIHISKCSQLVAELSYMKTVGPEFGTARNCTVSLVSERSPRSSCDLIKKKRVSTFSDALAT